MQNDECKVQNEQRERLIELLRGCYKECAGGGYVHYLTDKGAEDVADYLLENGVIVPPCKVGDTVWYISTENPHVAFQKELKPRTVKEPIDGILITKDGIYISTYNLEEAKNYFDKVGEDYAYLSEADAWAEIKRRERE